MRFNLFHLGGVALFAVAGVALGKALAPAPGEADLTWHEGTLVSPRVWTEQDDSIVFSVAGALKVFRHEPTKPAYDTLRTELTQGAQVAVLYDPAEEGRWALAWSVEKDGRTLLAHADMLEWDGDRKGFGVVLASVLGVLGLVLTVLGSRSKRRDGVPPA